MAVTIFVLIVSCLIVGKDAFREKVNVIKEAEYLIAQGYQEIILTGIHVGGYGQDLIDTSFLLWWNNYLLYQA